MPLTLHPKCLLTELDDGTAVVLNLETKFYYELNETGVFIWKQLAAGATDADPITEQLCRHFEVTQEQARKDVEQVLSTLRDEQLVVG